jgi:hypothetical protein
VDFIQLGADDGQPVTAMGRGAVQGNGQPGGPWVGDDEGAAAVAGYNQTVAPVNRLVALRSPDVIMQPHHEPSNTVQNRQPLIDRCRAQALHGAEIAAPFSRFFREQGGIS